MRGASVPVKYLLNVSTVCAPAIANVSVKLEKPTSMSPAHFAAAHDSVILATDVPVVTKGSQGKLIAKPQVQESLRPVSAPSASIRSSSSPRVLSIAPAAPPLSVTANIPIVKPAVGGSTHSAKPALSIAPAAPPLSVTANIPIVKPAVGGSTHSAKPALGAPSFSSDLMAILNADKKNSAAADSVILATDVAPPVPSPVAPSKVHT